MELPYNDAREQMLKVLSNHSNLDLISVDQIWLGEFADKGYLTELGNYSKTGGRLNDWYESNLDGAVYNDKIYGIWAWTDVRGIWYWKDLLKEAGVEPESLKTWNTCWRLCRFTSPNIKFRSMPGTFNFVAFKCSLI